MAVIYFTVVCHGTSELADPKGVAVLSWAVREILLKMTRGPHRNGWVTYLLVWEKTEINGFTNYNIFARFYVFTAVLPKYPLF